MRVLPCRNCAHEKLSQGFIENGLTGQMVSNISVSKGISSIRHPPRGEGTGSHWAANWKFSRKRTREFNINFSILYKNREAFWKFASKFSGSFYQRVHGSRHSKLLNNHFFAKNTIYNYLKSLL
jgi:hypothetical protein